MQFFLSCIGQNFFCLRVCSDGAGSTTRIFRQSSKKDKDRIDLQKEVLESLFYVPEKSMEAPKIIHSARRVMRSRAFGNPVIEPYKDTTREHIAAKRKIDARDGKNFQIIGDYSASLII